MNEYRYSDIAIGQKESFQVELSKDMEDAFRTITNDVNPLHSDDDFAREIGGGKFDFHVSFGMLSASFLSTLAGVYLPGKYSLIHSIDNVSFKKPVYAGDKLNITGTVTDKEDGLKLIKVKVRINNQDRKSVLTANMKVIVQK